jgi:hypothetical protein
VRRGRTRCAASDFLETPEELAAKRRKTPQKNQRLLFLQIVLAFLAAIESGCFIGMRRTPEGAAERGERRRKIKLRFFHLRSLFFGHPIFFFADRLCVFLRPSSLAAWPYFSIETKSNLFHLIPQKTILTLAFQKSDPTVSS